MIFQLSNWFKRINFIGLLLFAVLSTAQEIPPLDNYTPFDYNGQNQNWSLTQAADKKIYVANNGGLLVFNGAVWQNYNAAGGASLRSVLAVDTIVYSGGYEDFGFWKVNELGEQIYTTLQNKLNTPFLEEEEFWNIQKVEEFILFQSLQRIYSFNTISETFTVIDAKSTKAHMFLLDGTVYFQRSNEGLFKIINGKAILVCKSEKINNTPIVGLYKNNEKLLLITANGAFYNLEEGKLVEAQFNKNIDISGIDIYATKQLNNGTFILGTIANGVYQINQKGEVLVHINQEKGLNNNTVLSIFEDVDFNLWLGLDNGITVVNLNSPFKEYIDKNGKLGVVYASISKNNYLYLGTNQGLFVRHSTLDTEFKLVPNTTGQVWCLKEIEGTLFCGHNKGTFVVDNEKVELISSFPGTWDIKPFPNNKNLLLQGNYKGLSVLQKQQGKWQFKNSVDGFDISSRFFEFSSAGSLLINREYKGIYTLSLTNDYLGVKSIEHAPPLGKYASLVKYQNHIYYTCDNGIYGYNSTSKTFLKNNELTSLFYTDKDTPFGVFNSDEAANRLWCFSDNNILYASPGSLNTKLRISKVAIPNELRKNMGVLGFENITAIGGEKYLLGVSNGYLTLNLKAVEKKSYSIHLNTVFVKNNKGKTTQLSLGKKSTFKANENNITFSFAIPEFEKYKEVYYQYQINTVTNGWSNWSNKNSVSFENLGWGEYQFKVRAKIDNELSINEVDFDFLIKRPWYWSYGAIAFYICTFLILGFLIHKIYKRHYKKQEQLLLRENKKKLKRKRLKAERKIVQLKNEQLVAQINSKNRELATSTMSIIKKNEFLNTIKDKLNTEKSNPVVKNVLRTIDRNINNEDDWNVFEEAFNNADKDFLKKVKELHPDLTSNDLRLCAYLRLNLTSKEVAPLLNISVRSVEVKRYRLRKKMNLPHESSLSDYIISL